MFAESQIGAGPIPRVRCETTLEGLPMAGAPEGWGGREPSVSPGFSITGSVNFPWLSFLTFTMGIWSRHENWLR